MNKDIMRMAGFGKEVEKVELGLCPFCQVTIKMEDFRDDISRREYKISGLCQSCQDNIFGK
jgi:hypothetical protein